MKTNELTGAALDWAVAKCEGFSFGDWFSNDGELTVWIECVNEDGRGPAGYFPAWCFSFSSNWSAGGPIIEREKIELIPPRDEGDRDWMAVGFDLGRADLGIQEGSTPLIAAMRCLVASKLGDEVEIPKELKP